MGFNTKRVSRGAGELTVIVAGVLIALAADRWIANLDAQEMESAYLGMLVQDLEADSAAFAAQIAERQGLLDWSKDLQRRLANPSSTIAEPRRFLTILNYFSAWVPDLVRQSTWAELLSTGRLGLIRDADLRRQLGQYYSAAESAALGFDQMDRELAAHKAVIEQALEPEIRWVITGVANRPITQADAQAVLERIRNDRGLRSSLAAAGERHRNIIGSYQRSLERAVSLLSIVRAHAL